MIALVLLLGVSYMFNAMDRQVFPALLSAISPQCGLTLPQAGLVSVIFTVTVAIFGALSGWFMTRFLLRAMEGANSTESDKLVQALEGLRFKDGNQEIHFRDWDHQLIRRPVVGTTQPNAADKWDTLKVRPQSAADAAELGRLFGAREDIGCNMEAL